MTANRPDSENDLVGWAVAWMQERLPATWEITPTARVGLQAAPDRGVDAALDIKDPSGTYGTIAVQAKRSFGPRDVERLFGPMGRTLRELGAPIQTLVVSDWLSERTRELLREQSINYIDRTGNALVQLPNPTLFIQAQGADRNPNPSERGPARLLGPKAGRLVRALADFCPPYGVRDIAAAAGLSPGYASRLIQALDDDALIERDDRGRITSLDVARVLRRRAQTYDLFKSNTTTWTLARAGVGDTLDRIRATDTGVVVTGSFAATRLAPVAAPRLLVLYASDPQQAIRTFDLLPAEDGANVAILAPADDIVWERTTTDDGVTYVAPSQAAVDCLTGNGRMPSEGEALLDWMTKNEDRWRVSELPSSTRARR